MKVIFTALCLGLICMGHGAIAQQETKSSSQVDKQIQVELRPVVVGSGPVRVKIQVQNPFDVPMTFHSSHEQGCRMMEINVGKKVTELAAKGAKDVFVQILDPNHQTNLHAKLTILAQPSADPGSTPVELQKYLFIAPFVKTCDVVRALDGKFGERDFDFFVINRSHRKWEEIQIESKNPSLKFTSKVISREDAHFKDQYPDLALEYFGVKVEGNVSEPQVSFKVYAKLKSNVSAFQLVGEEPNFYLWHDRRR